MLSVMVCLSRFGTLTVAPLIGFVSLVTCPVILTVSAGMEHTSLQLAFAVVSLLSAPSGHDHIEDGLVLSAVPSL